MRGIELLGVPDDLNGKLVHDDKTTTSTMTIPKTNSQQAFLMIASNGPSNIPSLFALSRSSSSATPVSTIFQGSVPQERISLESDGSITVSNRQGSHIYYRLFVMES